VLIVVKTCTLFAQLPDLMLLGFLLGDSVVFCSKRLRFELDSDIDPRGGVFKDVRKSSFREGVVAEGVAEGVAADASRCAFGVFGGSGTISALLLGALDPGWGAGTLGGWGGGTLGGWGA
jgi:hypothetical protein